jgi:hypothetical protein
LYDQAAGAPSGEEIHFASKSKTPAGLAGVANYERKTCGP